MGVRVSPSPAGRRRRRAARPDRPISPSSPSGLAASRTRRVSDGSSARPFCSSNIYALCVGRASRAPRPAAAPTVRSAGSCERSTSFAGRARSPLPVGPLPRRSAPGPRARSSMLGVARESTCSYASWAAVTSPSRLSCTSPSRTSRASSVASVSSLTGRVELALEQLGELGVAAGLLVELRQPQHGLGVRRLLVEHPAQGLDRVLGRLEALSLTGASRGRAAAQHAAVRPSSRRR